MMNAFSQTNREVQDPPIARLLFSDTRSAWLWLIVRLYLGYEWFTAGLHKLTPAWLDGGVALKGFWERAIVIPDEGRPTIAFGWYRDFIELLLNAEAYRWFGPLIVFGEILIGVALIIGAFVGISAFFGALMNWNFIMAGAASTNAVLFTLAVLLMLAWKVAGYIGADYWLLSWLGTPWREKGATAEKRMTPTPA
jgi:thiosulfate dehydrogenase [quinone] large subunit